MSFVDRYAQMRPAQPSVSIEDQDDERHNEYFKIER